MYIKLTSIRIANEHETIQPTYLFGSIKPGAMVMVRPVDDEKTYLGMYLCSAPTGLVGTQVGESIVLTMHDYVNPAIYVPELDKIVWGYGSWWGEIESEDDLQQITDADIQDIWYVRALKQLAEEAADDNA